MNKLKIGNIIVGEKQKPYFIADIAANHDGQIERAFKLIELAKESGASAAKFQNFKTRHIVSDLGFNNLPQQLSHQKSWKKSVALIYEDASLPDDWSPRLKEKCDDVGIEYMTSPYDFASVNWAEKFVSCYKIGSGDITWHEIIEYIAQKGKPILLATGAASLQEVDMAVELINSYKLPLVLMQCNTNYTAKSENLHYLNLNVLTTYKNRYSNIVLGLSDHTLGYSAVLGAIALGARVIEKHFTDDNKRDGPDHRFSTLPTTWRRMVNEANKLFYSLGDGIKRIEKNELQTAIIQKRGLYATKSIKTGEVLTPNMLVALRPRNDNGFEPYEKPFVVEKKAARDILEGEIVLRKDVIE